MGLLEDVLKLSKSAKPLFETISYDEVVKEIKWCATAGLYSHYFDIDSLNEETKEMLKKEGFEVFDFCYIGKTKVSWEYKKQ